MASELRIFQRILGTESLPVELWAVALGAGAVCLIGSDLVRLVARLVDR